MISLEEFISKEVIPHANYRTLKLIIKSLGYIRKYDLDDSIIKNKVDLLQKLYKLQIDGEDFKSIYDRNVKHYKTMDFKNSID